MATSMASRDRSSPRRRPRVARRTRLRRRRGSAVERGSAVAPIVPVRRTTRRGELGERGVVRGRQGVESRVVAPLVRVRLARHGAKRASHVRRVATPATETERGEGIVRARRGHRANVDRRDDAAENALVAVGRPGARARVPRSPLPMSKGTHHRREHNHTGVFFLAWFYVVFVDGSQTPKSGRLVSCSRRARARGGAPRRNGATRFPRRSPPAHLRARAAHRASSPQRHRVGTFPPGRRRHAERGLDARVFHAIPPPSPPPEPRDGLRARRRGADPALRGPRAPSRRGRSGPFPAPRRLARPRRHRGFRPGRPPSLRHALGPRGGAPRPRDRAGERHRGPRHHPRQGPHHQGPPRRDGPARGSRHHRHAPPRRQVRRPPRDHVPRRRTPRAHARVLRVRVRVLSRQAARPRIPRRRRRPVGHAVHLPRRGRRAKRHVCHRHGRRLQAQTRRRGTRARAGEKERGGACRRERRSRGNRRRR